MGLDEWSDAKGFGALSIATQRAVKRLLAPLVRLLIARDIPYTTLRDLLKEVYVETAERHFALDDKPQTDSRVAMLTGVHRKDVRTLRQTDAPPRDARATSLWATVLGRWMGDPAFRGPDGRPAALAAAEGLDGASFTMLAAAVSKDVRPKTILDELERLGLVEVGRDDDGVERVRLLADALVPPAGSEEALGFFEANLHDHLAAAVANLSAAAAPAPFLERAVFYNALSAESVDALEAEARHKGLAALKALNETALARQKIDILARQQTSGDSGAAAAAAERFRFGVYFYREPAPLTSAGSERTTAQNHGGDQGSDGE